MIFDSLFAAAEPLGDSEKEELISRLLVAMVWADGHAHDAQADRMIHILARRFHLGDDEVRQKIEAFPSIDQTGVENIATKLCKSMPARERVMLLKDLWSIAASNGQIDLYEQDLFHRVAGLLHISEGAFLEKCIKMSI